jgi:hypothetical protein
MKAKPRVYPISANLLDLHLTKMSATPLPDSEDEDEFEDDYD